MGVDHTWPEGTGGRLKTGWPCVAPGVDDLYIGWGETPEVAAFTTWVHHLALHAGLGLKGLNLNDTEMPNDSSDD